MAEHIFKHQIDWYIAYKPPFLFENQPGFAELLIAFRKTFKAIFYNLPFIFWINVSKDIKVQLDTESQLIPSFKSREMIKIFYFLVIWTSSSSSKVKFAKDHISRKDPGTLLAIWQNTHITFFHFIGHKGLKTVCSSFLLRWIN